MAEIIYYDMSTDIAYREDGSQIANKNLPEFRFRELKNVEWRLLASNSVDGTGAFDDPYVGFAGETVVASCAIDNDAKHYDDGTVAISIASGAAITSIKGSGITATPRIAGRLQPTNTTGATETINYRGITASGSFWLFALANATYEAGAQTPIHNYVSGSSLRVLQLPIVKDAICDVTDKDTGKFVAEMDCDSLIYQSLIQGSRELSDCRMELKVLDVSANVLLAKEIRVKVLYILDDDGAVPPPPDWEGLTSVLALLSAGYDVEFSVDTSSWHATQTSADRYWRFRYPGGSWSTGMAMVVGTTGATGAGGATGATGATGAAGDMTNPMTAEGQFIRQGAATYEAANGGNQLSTTVTGSVDLALAHFVKGHLMVSGGTAIKTLTIRAATGIAYVDNSLLLIENVGASGAKIQAANGISLNGTKTGSATIGSYQAAYLRRRSSNVWILPNVEVS